MPDTKWDAAINLSQYRDLYFSDAHEQLARIAAALKQVEAAGGDHAALAAAFRAAHTLKGISATMHLDDVVASAHALEDLLQAGRDEPGGPSPSSRLLLFSALNELVGKIARAEAVEATTLQAAPAPAGRSALEGRSASSAVLPSVLRVWTADMDLLARLTAEIVAQVPRLRDATLAEGQASLDRHAQSIQALRAVAWQLRVAQIGEVLNRYPGLAREIAAEEGKLVRVVTSGTEIELGRAMLDELNEALLHLLRNAVAHGIETPVERLRAGKDPCGTIQLSAQRSGQGIVLEVSDDGRGLDPDEILRCALEQGFITEHDRRRLTGSQILDLIMLRGFSLSRRITRVSGRGVGMDVVKTKLDSLHGTIAIRSQVGSGTTFVLTVPPALGLVPAELVRVGDQVYALPTLRIERTLTLARADCDEQALGLRIIDLQTLLTHGAQPPSPSTDGGQTRGLVLVRQAGVALCVDELLGEVLLDARAETGTSSIPLVDLDRLLA